MSFMATLLLSLGLCFVLLEKPIFAVNPEPLPLPTPTATPDCNIKYGVYFTSCYPKIGTEYDDTERLQRAVNDTYVSGKIVFNEGLYKVHDSVILHSYLTLEGSAPTNPATGYSNSNITVTQGKPIFTILGLTNGVAIRDLNLACSGSSCANSIGIDAEGHNNTGGCTGSGPSFGFQFSNLRFTSLGTGIKFNTSCGYPDWQIDGVSLRDSAFENCITGVYLNAENSGWSMDNITFSSATNQDAINVPYGAYMSLNLIIGHGNTGARNFITMGEHGVVTIKNSESQNFTNNLIVNGITAGIHHSFPISLINNVFRDGISITNSSVVSSGNNYFYNNFNLLGDSQLYSLGDKFCLENIDPAANCKTGDFVIGGTSKVLFRSNENDTKIDTLRIGSVAQTALIAAPLSTASNGTLMYCTTCQQTSICSSGGSGAMAKRINGTWVCN